MKIIDKIKNVLILVLLEDGLWHLSTKTVCCVAKRVLILVLLEDGLWYGTYVATGNITAVSILVLLEDGLWPEQNSDGLWRAVSLNPCFVGRWSVAVLQLPVVACLALVLILVLLEDGLWHGDRCILRVHCEVLILVLLEDGLWQCSLSK